MIITRTPVRVSLFGGGSDYPSWFMKNGGVCLNITIDKYTYLTVRYLPPFFEHKYRIVWSLIENVKKVDEIQHPSVRECLKYMEITKGMEIHYDGDLPARSGLGASSSFTVGLLNALHTLKGETVDKLDLALEAIHVEQDLIREFVGCQDQIAAAVGGLNFMEFGNHRPKIRRVGISQERIKELESCLMLVFTGFPHVASEIASSYNFSKEYELNEITRMVYEAVGLLEKGELTDLGELLHESWQFKKKLSPQISNPYIDYVYETARQAGAIGGKLCGAGGGGFMLLFAKSDKQSDIKAKLGGLLFVPVKLEDKGTGVIFNNGSD